MKRIFLVALILSLVMASFVYAAEINIAAGKKVMGSFSNVGSVNSGVVTSAGGNGARSGSLNDTPQFITIDLGDIVYLDNIVVFWDKNAYSNNYTVRVSPNGKNFTVVAANLDAAMGAAQGDSMKIINSCNNALGRYVQVYMPQGSKVTNTAGPWVKILEIEAYAAAIPKFDIQSFNAAVVTENSAIVGVVSNIAASGGSVTYGTNPGNLDKTVGFQESGVRSSATLPNLSPDTTYYYKVTMSDTYGNPAAPTTVKNFTTKSSDIALGKNVEGTFTAFPPASTLVNREKPVLPRVTDGSTSYFEGMATSGPVPKGDQLVVIDLGAARNINEIVTYWRGLSYPESFKVEVSPDKAGWTTVGNNLNAADGVFSRSDAGDPMEVLNVNAGGVSGRYVKVLVPKGSSLYEKSDLWDFVQLMEVKVF